MNKAASAFGRLGGQVKSPAKRQAAAQNAKKATEARWRRVPALDGSIVNPDRDLVILDRAIVAKAVDNYCHQHPDICNQFPKPLGN